MSKDLIVGPDLGDDRAVVSWITTLQFGPQTLDVYNNHQRPNYFGGKYVPRLSSSGWKLVMSVEENCEGD